MPKKLLVYKQSKLEWDALLLGTSIKMLMKKYKKDGANADAIMRADIHQRGVRTLMEEALDCESETLADFESNGPGRADLVIVLGGDNSFTRVSQFCQGTTTILGINSDPDRSVGHLLSAKIRTKADATEVARKIHMYDYRIEEWQRIKCKINGRKIRLATSELFLGEKLRKNMSRHVMEHKLGKLHNWKHEYMDPLPKKIIKEHKCSGMVLATGAGSTGWLKSTSNWNPWENTKEEFRYQVTEPYGYNLNENNLSINGDQIYPGDTFKLTSLNDDGIVSVDSWEEYPFNRGAVAEISFGDTLKVMRFPVDTPEEKA